MSDEHYTCAGCGAELTPEDEECPKCGRLNIHSAVHRLGSKYRPFITKMQSIMKARQVLLKQEGTRLSSKSNEKTGEIGKLRQSLQESERARFPTDSSGLAEEIERTAPSKGELLIHGRVHDEQLLGIASFASRDIHISLRDGNRKPIRGMTKVSSVDENGYFSITLTQDEKNLLSGHEPTLVVVDEGGDVLPQFESKPLPEISADMHAREINLDITYSSIDRVKEEQEEREVKQESKKVSGIGSVKAEKLADKGINQETLEPTSLGRLGKILGIGRREHRKKKEAAKARLTRRDDDKDE
ncbi:MAG: hypothetical protein ACFE7R_09205 [Candidatus Hodarchaeota archaeon]